MRFCSANVTWYFYQNFSILFTHRSIVAVPRFIDIKVNIRILLTVHNISFKLTLYTLYTLYERNTLDTIAIIGTTKSLDSSSIIDWTLIQISRGLKTKFFDKLCHILEHRNDICFKIVTRTLSIVFKLTRRSKDLRATDYERYFSQESYPSKHFPRVMFTIQKGQYQCLELKDRQDSSYLDLIKNERSVFPQLHHSVNFLWTKLVSIVFG